ncbi:MAG TPA: SH3 domain-containing protein, partial [Phototrophicaceae bacterium]|nr:SH3 domain-containing protein [Phototrophicaceae bacterium]
KMIDSTPNHIRRNPGTSGEITGELPPGAVFEVIGSPVCVDGYEWYQIFYNTMLGYTAEGADGQYWLEPAEATPPTSVPTPTSGAPYIPPELNLSPDAITAANASQVKQQTRLGDGWVTDIAYSPDGKTFAIATTLGAWLYNVADYQPTLINNNRINDLAYNSTGSRVAGSDPDGIIWVWDTTTHELVKQINQGAPVTAIAVSSENILASADSGTIKIWDIASGQKTLEYKFMDEMIRAINPLVFTTDESGLIFRDYFVIYRLDFKSGELSSLGSIEAPYSWVINTDAAKSVIVPPPLDNGRFAQKLTVCDLLDLDACVIYSPEDELMSFGQIYFTPDYNLMLTPDGAGNLVIRSVDDLHPLMLLTGDGSQVAFSPDGRFMASGNNDGSIRLFSTPELTTEGAVQTKALYALYGLTESVKQIAFSSDGTRLIATDRYNGVAIWDTSTGESVKIFKGYTPPLVSVAFSPVSNRTIAAGSENTVVYVWHDTTLQTVFNKHSQPVDLITFSPDGQLIASVDCPRSSVLRLWEAKTGKQTGEVGLTGCDGHSAIFFDMNDDIILVTNNQDPQIIHRTQEGLTVGPAILPFEDPYYMIFTADLSPDNRFLIIGYWVSGFQDGILQMIDVSTGSGLKGVGTQKPDIDIPHKEATNVSSNNNATIIAGDYRST